MPGDNGTHGQTAFHFHSHPFLAVVVAGPAGLQKYDRPNPPAIALENEDAVAVVVGRPLRAGLAKTSFTSTLGRRDNF
ncbi:hypothetical protein QR685DRAFT_567826 [Neurospora intermedia]|uniref:Uncharacterized protein n=1 Tax=Neurospora intermedia TaxID=5142 RepID=A0ABR3DQL1_NEUIN